MDQTARSSQRRPRWTWLVLALAVLAALAWNVVVYAEFVGRDPRSVWSLLGPASMLLLGLFFISDPGVLGRLLRTEHEAFRPLVRLLGVILVIAGVVFGMMQLWYAARTGQ